ncbi:putative toxin-antitoxin system toxin component, PIN family [Candidatus Fermentibacteria bacterium]|nr:putative toxin-antitoxin system toxin component, PIN family [Candidatus Fermentibacteria bacterium]
MKIVLDTNVLVAAFIARGTCHEVLEHCMVHHEVVVSTQILDELQEVLMRKFDYSQAETHAVVDLLQTRVFCVTPAPMPLQVCRDPDDDVILATALCGRCTVIVTGDTDLTDLGRYEGITILTPRDFWAFEQEFGGTS